MAIYLLIYSLYIKAIVPRQDKDMFHLHACLGSLVYLYYDLSCEILWGLSVISKEKVKVVIHNIAETRKEVDKTVNGIQ